MNTLEKLFELQQQKKELAAQAKQLDGEIKALQSSLPEGLSTSEDGMYVVDVRPSMRFDAATAKKNLTEELYNAICELKPSSTMAKKVLTGFEYEDCQRVVGVTATVKKASDLG